jgi:ABC-type multidrug transport system fused ATPase/permease subunit
LLFFVQGGERQRLEIARIFLRNPKVLIMDEVGSSLDERTMIKILGPLRKNRTTITIAHRLSAVRDCDEIFVVKNGSIVSRGTHQQLMSSSKGWYAITYQQQLGTPDSTCLIQESKV